MIYHSQEKNIIKAVKELLNEFLDKDSYYFISRFEKEKQLIYLSLEKNEMDSLNEIISNMKRILELIIYQAIQKHEKET